MTMSNAIKSGPELLVNTTADSHQTEPAIAALADGRFVVTWTDWSATGGDTSTAAIRAQIFDANGNKLDEEFLVNTTTTQGQNMPAVAALADGRFLIAWTDASRSTGDTSGAAVRAQIFNAGGVRDGAEFIVPAEHFNNQFEPAVAGLADGRFVAVWTDFSGTGDPSQPGIRGRMFEADGEPGAEFQVNATTANYQGEPTIAVLTDGRFVAAWTDYSETGGDTSSAAIRARIFDSDGAPGGEFLVNTTTDSAQFAPTITALANGGFVVAWSAGDSFDFGIFARVFGADGAPVDDEFLVNATTAQRQTQPSITALPDGRFVAVWADASGSDASGFAVRAQVFEADGDKSGAELVVNTTGDLAQWLPSVTTIENGNVVVAWEDHSGNDGDGSAIRAQIFTFSEPPVITSNGGGDSAVLTVNEHTTAVTTVTAADPDGPTLSYSIAGGVDAGKFLINSATGALSFSWPRDFEAPEGNGGDNSYEVIVAASDGTSSDLQTITVNVADVNEAPAIISHGGYPSVTRAILENTLAVTTMTAADPDGDALTISIAGGEDAALFQIDAATGVLSFITAPDHEMPADADHNNSYVVQVRASDGELFGEQTITVEVNDTAENSAPVITSNGGGDSATIVVVENSSTVTTVTAVDPGNDALTYSIVGGEDEAFFRIDASTGALSFVNGPDFEAPADADHNNRYVVEVGASDGDLFDVQTITVDATDLAAPGRSGDEFLLNTATESFQEQPTIAGLANGRFVVAWMDYSQSADDPSHNAIRAQVFNADGSKAGGEFLVNTTTPDSQHDPDITALADGRFLVAWTDYSQSGGDTSQAAVRAQVFNADGTRSSSEFLIPATTAQSQYAPSVTELADGRFVATWGDDSNTGGDTNGNAVRARIFNADGSPSGGDLLVNTNTSGFQYEPTITALADGSFVVAWTDWNGTGNDQSGPSVRAQVFRADGTPLGSELLVNTTTDNSQENPSITALADGRFVVAWSDYSMSQGDTSDYAVRARIFDADGSESVAEFLVNTTTYALQWRPQVTALADGRFVASWVDNSGGTEIVRAQVFETDGAKSGDEFVAGAPPTGWVDHAITALADGRFVIAWHGSYAIGGDTSATSIHAQIFDPREGPVNLVGTPLEDDLVGTAFNDTITGRAGDDRLDGGAGEDTAVFSQSRDKYAIIDFGDMIAVQGSDGTDLLYNVEHLQFAAAGPTPPIPTPPQAPDLVSGLFDTRYYLANNPDVSAAKVGALDHYDTFGWHEGRDPNAWFDTGGYLAANPGATASGLNPLDHYHQIGWREGRDPGASFDTRLYLIHNPDVAAAGVDPLEHYMQHGRAEGRAIYQAVGESIVGGFDAEYYLFHNPDVAAAGVDPHFHYNVVGWQEGRDPNAWFDSAGYLSHYTDVAAAGINPLQHYEAIGWKEGRDASIAFDTAGYLAANPDVAAAGINPLDHFLQNGIYEGRQAVNDGMWG
jgi:hypothetical protein